MAPRFKIDLSVLRTPKQIARSIHVAPDPLIEARVNREVDKVLDLPPDRFDPKESQDYDREEIETLRTELRPSPDDSHLPERLVDPDFPWDESQTEAIVGLSRVQRGNLIGAAGTGKTTCEKRLVDILLRGDDTLGVKPMETQRVNLKHYWDRTGAEPTDRGEQDYQRIVPSILLCAYTGQATQNIKKNFPRSWHGNIMTVHSALGYHPEEEEYVEPGSNEIKTKFRFVPFYTASNPMPWDVVIIDEASMLNLQLWHELLDASKSSTRFYFIGDINQLPPTVGEGVLAYSMAKLPVFELRHIHRQKEAAANRIIETAWDILQGQQPVFDDGKENPNWRVLGFELAHDVGKASQQIVSIAQALRQKRITVVEEKGGELRENPDYPIYDPWRDRILTCMNGFNPGDPASPIGQAPLNEVLSLLFSENTERLIIDAGRETKKFAVGYRVMATKNESPSVRDRITNGMTGIITEIVENADYTGDPRLVGLESKVKEERARLVATLAHASQDILKAFDPDNPDDTPAPNITLTNKVERIEGAASHTVVVDFNGIIRSFTTKNAVEQLQIAYASTVHKTQGSEMDTAIVIIHHAQKRMLCRESFYTAVTRATKRLIILHTPHGMKLSLAKQKIFGNNLEEKIRRYLQMAIDEANGSGLPSKVRLTKED